MMMRKRKTPPKPPADFDDSPPLTEAMLARARPSSEVHGKKLAEAMQRPKRGRPAKAEHERKQPVSIRLSPDVLDALRESGEGWQTRVDDILRAALLPVAFEDIAVGETLTWAPHNEYDMMIDLTDMEVGTVMIEAGVSGAKFGPGFVDVRNVHIDVKRLGSVAGVFATGTPSRGRGLRDQATGSFVSPASAPPTSRKRKPSAKEATK